MTGGLAWAATLFAAHGVERVVHPLDHVEGVHDPPRVGAAARVLSLAKGTVIIKGSKLNQSCFKNMLYGSSIKTIKLSGQSSSVKAKYRSWIRAASGSVRVI